MAHHTPGPYQHGADVGANPHAVYTPDGRLLALFGSAWLQHADEDTANARLFTAAPDLLAACEAALVGMSADNAAAQQLRVAIARATQEG